MEQPLNTPEYEFENSLKPFPLLIEKHYSLTIDELRQVAIKTLNRFRDSGIIDTEYYHVHMKDVQSGYYIHNWNDEPRRLLTIIGIFTPEKSEKILPLIDVDDLPKSEKILPLCVPPSIDDYIDVDNLPKSEGVYVCDCQFENVD